jgi:hypothetical protein
LEHAPHDSETHRYGARIAALVVLAIGAVVAVSAITETPPRSTRGILAGPPPNRGPTQKGPLRTAADKHLSYSAGNGGADASAKADIGSEDTCGEALLLD